MHGEDAPTVVKTAGFVVLTLAFHREGKVWVGICQELGTSTYGRTLDRASDELQEMVILHLHALEQEGEREYFLEKHNIQFYAAKPTEVKVKQPIPINDAFFQPRTFPITLIGSEASATRLPALV